MTVIDLPLRRPAHSELSSYARKVQQQGRGGRNEAGWLLTRSHGTALRGPSQLLLYVQRAWVYSMIRLRIVVRAHRDGFVGLPRDPQGRLLHGGAPALLSWLVVLQHCSLGWWSTTVKSFERPQDHLYDRLADCEFVVQKCPPS